MNRYENCLMNAESRRKKGMPRMCWITGVAYYAEHVGTPFYRALPSRSSNFGFGAIHALRAERRGDRDRYMVNN